jgi:hypothetical protein
MQIDPIKERISKINHRWFYTDFGFRKTSQLYDEWMNFLTMETDKLNLILCDKTIIKNAPESGFL